MSFVLETIVTLCLSTIIPVKKSKRKDAKKVKLDFFKKLLTPTLRNHQKYLSYNPEEFVRWAEDIGTHTLKTVNYFLYSEKEPEQGYKYCVGLMKAAEKYGNSRIEKACEKLLTITVQPSLRSIITILKTDRIS